MTRALIALFFMMLSTAPRLNAADSNGAREQKIRQSIIIPDRLQTNIGHFALPSEVYKLSEGRIGTIRIATSNGEIRPYSIRTFGYREESVEIPVTLLNQATDNRNRSRMELDLGGAAGVHNALTIRTTTKNFLRGVQIEGSDDRMDWWMVCDDALIFVFSINTEQSCLTVEYPDSRYRYLRVTVEGSEDDPVELSGASLKLVHRSERMTQELDDVPFRSETLMDPFRTRIRVDFERAGIPKSEAVFDIQDEAFYREMTILAGIDEDRMTPIGCDCIYKYRKDGSIVERLTVKFPETTERWMAFDIIHHDNAELKIENMSIRRETRYLFLEVQPREALWIYYGGNDAPAPVYDFDWLHASLTLDKSQNLTLGEVELNPEYKPSAAQKIPLTKASLLWIVLIGAALALGAIAIRQLRSIQ